MNFVVYTVKFAKVSDTKHVYTKTIDGKVVDIEFKEYFDVMVKAGTDKYNEYYAYGYSTFSITKELHERIVNKPATDESNS